MYLVIDIGSNTIRAVVFRIEGGALIPVLNKKYSAGLAGYIEEGGAMSRAGIELCVEILDEIRIIMEAFDFDGIYPFATASLRNISNSGQVLAELENRCGIKIRLLTGKEEAFYDYYGAAGDIGDSEGILVDIGGGSTEIVVYRSGKAEAAESIRIGSLNLYNKYVSDLFPSRDEIKAMQEAVKKQLYALDLQTSFPEGERPVICAVGGSARAALKLYNIMFEEDRNNHLYKRCFLKKILTARWNKKELTGLILKTAPERIHTLLPGIAVLYTISKYYGGKTIITGSHGVREGYLRYQLEKEGALHD